MSSLIRPPFRLEPGVVVIGRLIGADFNSTADQPITLTLPGGKVRLNVFLISNASISLTTAAGGIYTGAGKTGTAIVASSQTYSTLTASTKVGTMTLATVSDLLTATTLYFSLTTPQGAAATADILLLANPVV